MVVLGLRRKVQMGSGQRPGPPGAPSGEVGQAGAVPAGPSRCRCNTAVWQVGVASPGTLGRRRTQWTKSAK